MIWNQILLLSLKTTPEEKKEIIEIGIGLFKLQEKRLEESVSLFVKPTKNVKITDKCTKITGIAASDVSDAANFFDVYSFIENNFDSKKTPWICYGNFAKNMLEQQCENFNLEFLMSDKCINLRHFITILNGGHDLSLVDNLEKIGVSWAGRSCEDEVCDMAILLKSILSSKTEPLHYL